MTSVASSASAAASAEATNSATDGPRRVLVACSGGPDSVALTHVLARLAPELGFVVSVASVDHRLRAESAAEVDAVGRFAQGLGLRFHALRVEGLAARPSGSLQAAARDARYAALLELAASHGYGVVAVGHTMDDQAETVLSRLLRGSGVHGLAGVSVMRADGVVRPLIDARRSDVEAWVVGNGLSVVRDPSNDDHRFERVRIRQALLPALTAENPRLVVHLAQLADEARSLSTWIEREAHDLRERAVSPHRGAPRASSGAYVIDILRRAPEPVLVAFLRLIVAEHCRTPAKRAHIDALSDLVRAAHAAGRNVRLPANLVAEYWQSGQQAELVLREAPTAE